MSRLPHGLAFVAALVIGPSCIDGPGDPMGVVDLDYDTFVTQVQPVLAEGCANPSCHGREDRPLEIFAVQRHRLDPADLYRDTPLTEEELRYGYERARSFVAPTGDADASPLILKPLAMAEGGAHHAGGAQFESTWDAGYLVLLDWVATAEAAP